MVRSASAVLATFLAVVFNATASGAVIMLSEFSSDSTPANVLDAGLDFSITGVDELTLSVTNDTVDPDEYNINFVYFNATTNVSGLSLNSATSSIEGDISGGWQLNTASKADGFGTFDFELADGVGKKGHTIHPGETVAFVFTISGSGPFTAGNFTTELSSPPPPDRLAIVAAKFISGPCDDSAYGATASPGFVPEPASAALLMLAAVGINRRRGRRG